MPTKNQRRWASQADVAEYLGLSDRTVRQHIAQGRFPAYRLGNRTVRIDLNDVDEALRLIPTAGGGVR